MTILTRAFYLTIHERNHCATSHSVAQPQFTGCSRCGVGNANSKQKWLSHFCTYPSGVAVTGGASVG